MREGFQSNSSMLIKNVLRVRTPITVFKCYFSAQQLKEIFFKSLDAVLPTNLIRNEVQICKSHLLVRGESFSLRKPCHMVGFGKAVLGMAAEMENTLGSQLKRAVVTVPMGIFETHKTPENSRIQFIEGAKNNLPDRDASKGAERIKELAEGLEKDDLLIVLISGEKWSLNEKFKYWLKLTFLKR